jgi:hypothetical protein
MSIVTAVVGAVSGEYEYHAQFWFFSETALSTGSFRSDAPSVDSARTSLFNDSFRISDDSLQGTALSIGSSPAQHSLSRDTRPTTSLDIDLGTISAAFEKLASFAVYDPGGQLIDFFALNLKNDIKQASTSNPQGDAQKRAGLIAEFLWSTVGSVFFATADAHTGTFISETNSK